MMSKVSITLLALFTLLLFGCQQETPQEQQKEEATQGVTTEKPSTQGEAPQVEPPATKLLMSESVVLQRFESIADALPIWRQFAEHKPTLLLLSDKPQLIPPPEFLRDPIDHLLEAGSAEAIRLASSYQNPEALLKPSMSVDVALGNEWFKKFVWIFPSRDPELDPDLEMLRTEFTRYGIINSEEAATLTLQNKAIQGTVRATDFTASALKWLSEPDTPVIIHIDLSYFQSLYKNEIATPVLQTIYATLQQLKEVELNILAVTFSYSHMDSRIALDVRFIGEILTTLLAQPEKLETTAPANWQRQANAIYLANFFQKEQVEEIFKAQQKDDAESAWVNFNLYRSSAELKEGSTALDYLFKAVALDPTYAMEYANLSQMAYDKNRPDEALRMLFLASKTFPEDPFIKLRIIQLAQETGDFKTAKHLLEQLQELNWSDVYYPNMPGLLSSMSEELPENLD